MGANSGRAGSRRSALLDAVRSATLAPSVHNSQPWRFVLRADGVELFADRSRTLPALDPEGRLLVLSCGAALLNARVALRGARFDPEVRLHPEGPHSDLLARVSVRSGRPPTAEEQALAEAVARRHSQRRRLSSNLVPAGALTRLEETARAEGAWLRPLRDEAEREVFATLLENADYLERTDPTYREELHNWVRG